MKKLCLLLLFFTLLFTMTACNSATVEKTSQPESTSKNRNADFRYGNIGWNSSYSDVVRDYGEPDLIQYLDTSVIITYYDASISDYTFHYLGFSFTPFSQRLTGILASKGDIPMTVKEMEKLYRTFKFKYGEPDTEDVRTKNGEFSSVFARWDNAYEGMSIMFSASYDTVYIRYNNNDFSNTIRHNDLPTPKPTSTPNLNGI